MESVVERFLRYVAIDSQSDESSDTCPSTEKQKVLGRLLVEELRELGLKQVRMDEFGYVYGSLPANTDQNISGLGFIAHMDTSPDFNGKDVRPRIVENYQGEDILLNKEDKQFLSPADFPELLQYKGQSLIVTDGRSLLGADDKAGIAEIMTALQYLISHPEIRRGPVQVAFTPDEEIGRGADHFDVAGFGAEFAYTVDGGRLGELEYENFNAALATLRIEGRGVHPGYAKGKLLNALQMAADFNQVVPSAQRPEHTNGYEGFYHLIEMEGDVNSCVVRYLIRDHAAERFQERKDYLVSLTNLLNKRYGGNRFSLEITDQYYNMKSRIEPVMHIVELAREAMLKCGITPIVKPIRGGTDGARLSYMGLPCPNLFTGGHNAHGKYEFIPIPSMTKACEVLVEMVRLQAR